MIEIDGKYLEGGGQILRTALSLSAVTKKPCCVFNIRKGRSRPGLMTQHLVGIRALAEICQGQLEGDELESQEITFYPKEIQSKNLNIKIETAASITLVLQALILPCLQVPSPVKISFHGGATDTFFSPTIDYFRCVFLKILEKITSQKVADITIQKRGFYPGGGAEVEITIYPSKLKPFNLVNRGPLKQITIISGASEYLRKNKVAERQISGVKEILSPKLKLPIKEIVEYYNTACPGSQINIIGDFQNTIIGADNLGKLEKSAEQVGKEAAQNFFTQGNLKACLDKHLADQILPFMAFASGPEGIPLTAGSYGVKKSKVSVSEITKHLQTNIWVIEKFLNGKFETKNSIITWNPA